LTLRLKHQDTNIFTPPTEGFRILSFDRPSKGNLGQGSYGGFIQDENSSQLDIYAFPYDITTNNRAKLFFLEKGLKIVI